MIEKTKKLVEDKFTVLKGYEHNAEVHYLLLFLRFQIVHAKEFLSISCKHF